MSFNQIDFPYLILKHVGVKIENNKERDKIVTKLLKKRAEW